MYRPYRRRKGKPTRRPTMYPIPSPTIAPAAAPRTTPPILISPLGPTFNDSSTSGGGKECSGNKDCLSGERHAGTFERDNTKDDPWAVDWDQANQGIGQRR